MDSKITIRELCEKKIATTTPNFSDKINYIDIASVDNQKKKIVSMQLMEYSEAPSRARQIVQYNDVLVSTVRPNLNAIAIVNTENEDYPLVASTGYCVLRCKPQLNPKYLFYFCQSPAFITSMASQATGASYPAVNSSIVRNEEIPFCSTEMQYRIVAIFEAIDQLISKRHQQLEKLDTLVKSQFIEMFGDPMLNPKNWPVHQLSEHIKFLTSGSRGWAKYFTDDGEYFITIKNVKDCRITLDNMQHITPPDNAEAKRAKVQTGDLLISITADLGRTGVVSEEIAEHGAYINQHLTCIRLDQNTLDPLYTAYYMESEAGKSQFESKNQSAVKAGLNFNSINSLKVMIPPMELQKSFVRFIEQTDKSKFAIQQSLDKLETLKKALMQEYFG